MFLNDVIIILENKQFVQAALSDLIRVFNAHPSKIFLSRKCTFFLSLFNSYSDNLVADLMLEIKIEAQKERDELLLASTTTNPSNSIDPIYSKKPLIEILDDK